MYSDVSEEDSDANYSYSKHSEHRNHDHRHHKSKRDRKSHKKSHHVPSVVKYASSHRHERDGIDRSRSRDRRSHHSSSTRYRSSDCEMLDGQHQYLRYYDIVKSPQMHDNTDDTYESEKEHKKKRRKHKHERSSSRERRRGRSSSRERKRHKSHKKKHRHSRERSKSNPLKSSSFIDEILHNESLQKDNTILKEVITILENESHDTNNNETISYTPPMPEASTEVVEAPPPPPFVHIEEKIEQALSTDYKNRKRSVLDLPMPPNIIMGLRMEESWESTQCNPPLPAEELIPPPPPPEEEEKVPLPPGKRKRPTYIKKFPRPRRFPSKLKGREVENFHIIEQVGEGTYGKVYKALDKVDERMVAMKMIRMENETDGIPITCLREIKILQQLDHPNIIQLNDVIFDSTRNHTFLIFEYMNHDLLGLMSNPEMTFHESQIYHIIRQVLEGLKFCHENSIMHRDLKSSNILLHSDGTVKLADFGLSRNWKPKRPFTNKVISLWYRPIEILLGEEFYTPAVDIWSVGCIMTELFKRAPLFPFNNEFEVIDAIFKVCGTPDNNFWPEANRLSRFRTLTSRISRRRALREILSAFMPPVALDLVDKMLVLNPNRRITARDALKSMWIVNMENKFVKPLRLPSVDCFEYRVKLERRMRK